MVLKQRFIFFSISQILILKDKPKVANADANILIENEDITVNTILFGKPNSENSFHKAMLNASIEFTLSTEKFNNSLF